jgi:hypothetical protein
MNKILEKRFWDKVDIKGKDECWNWLGGCNRAGYGQFRVKNGYFFNLPNQKMMAHRLAYELCIGVIIPGKKILHKCDNPPCCNPAHLWMGTQKENIQDCLKKGRRANLHGERNPRAKLTEDDVREIRKRILNHEKDINIAHIFCISVAAIWQIRKNNNWV